MSDGFRAMKVYLALVGFGLLAAIARIFASPSAPTPRWDLLVCLLVALAGAVGCLIDVRRGTPSGPAAIETRRYWWPEWRKSWMGFGLFIWVVPVLLLVYATVSQSPEPRRIADAGHTISEVKVRQVLSSDYSRNERTRNGNYVSVVEVAVPFGDGTKSVEGKVFSEKAIRPGDQLWALYAPSSAGLGAILDSERGPLQEKIGGSVGWPLVLLVAGWSAWWLILAWLCGSVGSSLPGLKAGRLRSLSVSAVAGGVARSQRSQKATELSRPNPHLLLEPANGQRLLLFLDRAVEPVSLAQHVEGRPAQLYWAPRSPTSSHDQPKTQAVMVVSSEQYVRGWVESATESPLLEGSPVPAAKHLPAVGELRALRTLPVWDPALHSVGFWALQIALLALSIMTLGVGPIGTAILAAVALLSLPAAWVITASRRTRRLEGLLLTEEAAGTPGST